MSAQVSNTEAFKSLFFHQLPPKGTQSQTELTRIVDHRFFSTQLQCKNKTKTQTNNKTTKLPKKFIKNQSEKESKERDRIQREIKVQQVLLRRKDIISCFAFSFIQMCVCQSVVVFCEATRRPVRRAPARCSTTATAAGAAERPGPRAVWRQPSFSGWRWMYLDRLSEDPGRRTGDEEVSIMYKKKM